MNSQREKKAVVLFSGGLDSTTVLAIAINQGYEVNALSLRYGQRHEHELVAAAKIAATFKVKQHLIIDIDLRKIGGSALTDDIDVPKSQNIRHEANSIPITYVPARNTIFLSLALAWAEVLGTENIFIGANAIDFSGYPDCRPEYIAAFERMANLATRAGLQGKKIKIHAPLLKLTKAEIIKKGVQLGVDYRLTHSCYDPSPDGRACGLCESCLLRKKGFQEAGFTDPTSYEVRS